MFAIKLCSRENHKPLCIKAVRISKVLLEPLEVLHISLMSCKSGILSDDTTAGRLLHALDHLKEVEVEKRWVITNQEAFVAHEAQDFGKLLVTVRVNFIDAASHELRHLRLHVQILDNASKHLEVGAVDN